MRSFAVFLLALGSAPSLVAAEPRLDVGPHFPDSPAGARPRLAVEPLSAATVAASALALWVGSEIEQSSDRVIGCRWCDPGSFDRWARRELRWNDTRRAAAASDLLLRAVPLGSAAVVASLAARQGDTRAAVEDVLVVAAALTVVDPLTTGVKHATARLRPEAWAAGRPRVEGDLHSFFSGHTSLVFTAAAAATEVTRLRGRPAWKWVAAVGFAAAATTGWLRVAADQHWATDVLAGAAVGTATGFGVATVALRPRRSNSPCVLLVPAPGGLAFTF